MGDLAFHLGGLSLGRRHLLVGLRVAVAPALALLAQLAFDVLRPLFGGGASGFGSSARLRQTRDLRLTRTVIVTRLTLEPQALERSTRDPEPERPSLWSGRVQRRREDRQRGLVACLAHERERVVGVPCLECVGNLGPRKELLDGAVAEFRFCVDRAQQLLARGAARQAATIELGDGPQDRRNLARLERPQYLACGIEQGNEERLGHGRP